MNQSQKVVLITTMVFLKALHVLFVHESTHRGEDGGEEGSTYQYNTVMAVILAEFIKLALSGALFLRAYIQESSGHLISPDFSARKDWEEMTFSRGLSYAFPALVYMIEDNLRFIVMQHLHTPVTWMIFGHLEIPFVAIMSATFLGRMFSRTQWISIVLLLSGVMSSQVRNPMDRVPPASTR